MVAINGHDPTCLHSPGSLQLFPRELPDAPAAASRLAQQEAAGFTEEHREAQKMRRPTQDHLVPFLKATLKFFPACARS